MSVDKSDCRKVQDGPIRIYEFASWTNQIVWIWRLIMVNEKHQVSSSITKPKYTQWKRL